MKDLEISMSIKEDTNAVWEVKIYNPNYGYVVLEREQEFATKEEALCWFETAATLEKTYERSFIGKITGKDMEYAEKMLKFQYSDIA